MTFFQAIVLGAVQGITEFLPVSSTAHVTIFSQLLGCRSVDKAFSIFLNAGSLLAIMVFFLPQVQSMIIGFFDCIFRKETKDRYFFTTVFLTSLPAIIVFGILEILFNASIDSNVVSAISLIAFAVVMYFCDLRPNDRTVITRKDSILMGFAQLLSFVPGASRLGVCLSMMRYLNYSREESFRHAMVMSVPLVSGACSLKILKVLLGTTTIENWSMVAAGCVSAFVFGLISLTCMIKFLQRNTLLPLVVYRILLGILILWKIF